MKTFCQKPIVRPTGLREVLGILVLLLSALGEQALAQQNGTAETCAKEKNPDLKVQLCTRAIQSGQLSEMTRAVTFNNRGEAYYRKGQFDRAIEDYDAAIRLKPNDFIAFNNRGKAYARKGQDNRPIHDKDTPIPHTPNYP